MTKTTIAEKWWDEGKFFGSRRYFIGDNSFTGYLPGVDEQLEVRTKREAEGVADLLDIKRGGSILDVPAGYGRHSNFLAQKGFDMTGIDIYEEHLKIAKADALERKIQVNYQKGDMKDIGSEHHGRYDGVINMTYSFGFFMEERDNVQTMKQFYNSLKDGGQLLLHTDVSPEMIKNGSPETDAIRRLPDDKKLIIIEEYNQDISRMEGSWEITDNIGRVVLPREFYSVRIYTEKEFIDMARCVGFEDAACYGSFNGEPFSSKSTEMILVAKK